MRRVPQRASKRILDRGHMEWQEFDPRVEEYYNANNHYTSGPGLHLPPSLPYAMRTNAMPYKLFVSGIHPHTTEEGIRHIFCNYGKPLSVIRTRNKLQQPIAFVEFESQCEADNAVIELDGKPPLNWEVCYAMTRCNEERVYPQFANLSLESDFERQTPMFQTSGISRQPLHSRLPVFTDKESSTGPTRATNTILNFPKQEVPTCFVCGAQAPLVCTICKTRYCSQICQGSDWPTHQHICRPPPALEPVNQHVHASDRVTQLRLACGKSNAAKNRDYPNVSSSHQSSDSPVAVEQTRSHSADVGQNHRPASAESASSHSYIIKGIKPLDQYQMGSSNQRAVDLSVTIHRNINSGSRTKKPDVRIVKDVNDGPVKYGINQTGTRDMQVTEQNKPTQGFTRSPNLTNNYDTSKNSYKSSTVSPKQNQTTLNERQYENRLDMGAVPKSLNFPIVNVSPTTRVESAHQKPQLPASAAKIYAQNFSPGRLQLVSDKPSKVLVCFSKSPYELYIQHFTFREILEELMESIKNSVAVSDPLVNPTEGLPCLAIFHADNCWYRAQVMKVLPDGIGIRYVDFGNTAKMPNTQANIRRMEYSLSEYPFYATKVKLADVFPINGSSWDSDVCLRFREIVNDQTFLMECVEQDADTMSVRLKNKDGSDLVTRLLQEGLVRKTPLKASDELDRLPIATATTALPRSQQAIHNLQTSNSQLPGSRSGTSTASSPVHRSPQAQERVQAVTPKESTGTSLTMSEQSPLPAHSPIRAALRQDASFSQPRAPTMPSAPVRPISLPSRPLPSAHSPLPPMDNSIIEVLEAGMTVIFQVTVRMSRNRFIGMLIRDEDDMGIIEFDSLAETIESVPDFQPTVGSVVAARSLVDNQWYRGCITKVLKSTYSVLYVDYGNVEEGVVSVKPIPSSYRHLTLCVKLSVAENSPLGINQYMDETMVLDSSHQLEVTAKAAKDSVLAKIITEDVPNYAIQLDPWTSLLPKLDDAPEPIPLRDIASPNWEIGFSCEVMPFVAEDVNCIFVQAVTDETVALTCKIQEELKEYLPTSLAVSTIPVIGSCVAAIFPDDGELYRARIVETTGNSVSLFYVDFGNSTTVSLSDVRVLPDRFYDYPACCKQVSLARVVRPEGPLPTAVKDLLSSCINKIFKMLVLPSTSQFTECVLTQDGEVLNELIVDIFEQSSTRAGTSPRNHMPKLEAASPERDRTRERDALVDNTLSETSYDDGPFMELPEERPFQAVISNVEGPQLIMLRVLNDQISTKLVRLEEELEAYATAIVRGYGPKLNEICIARYPDGKWYRSACLDEIADPAGKRYMCIQVDYGETHIVDVDDIRRIPKRLIDCMPYQAQHTILEGTESMEEVKTELSTRLGELLPNNSQVTVSVVSRVEMAYVVRIPEISAILSSEGLL